MAWALVGATVVACGDGDPGGPDAQPLPDATTFDEGDFDQIPRYPGSQAVSGVATQGDTVVQSYSVTNVPPDEVLAFFQAQLAEWQVVDQVDAIGPDAYRGRWQRQDALLEVSAALAPGLEQNDAADQQRRITQYSLTLRPA